MEGISALRDESDKDGMRIVIEVKRDAVGEVVLNNLYSQTQLQVSFASTCSSAPWSAEDHEPEGHHRRVCTPPP